MQVHASAADDTSNKNGRSRTKQITYSILSVDNSMGTQNFYLNNLNKFKKYIRRHTMLTLYNKMSTTSTQQNENMAAIGSRPIRAHHSSHVHARFLCGIELCCIRCKKLVQEKSCTRNRVRRSSFLYKSTCYLYKFLDCVSPPLGMMRQRLWSYDSACLCKHQRECG